jgi:hypothetical protein
VDVVGRERRYLQAGVLSSCGGLVGRGRQHRLVFVSHNRRCVLLHAADITCCVTEQTCLQCGTACNVCCSRRQTLWGARQGRQRLLCHAAENVCGVRQQALLAVQGNRYCLHGARVVGRQRRYLEAGAFSSADDVCCFIQQPVPAAWHSRQCLLCGTAMNVCCSAQHTLSGARQRVSCSRQCLLCRTAGIVCPVKRHILLGWRAPSRASA